MGAATDGAGVRVEHVIHGSPAERASVRAGDRITQIDGAAVATSRDVVRALRRRGAGDVVSVTISRGGKAQPVSVVLADYPSGDAILRMDHVGMQAPAWDGLQFPAGSPASLAGLRGSVVVVDFWASWCGPCRELAPKLSRWQSRYGAQGLAVVGITTDAMDDALLFKERLDLRYPMASDPSGHTSRAYGVSALPTLFVIDRRGVVREVAVGSDPEQEARIESLIGELLAEPAAGP